jgi:hypothetical protein
MKQQIAKFSPHQNAKVLAVLMAIGSLVFVLPFMLFAGMMTPEGMGPPMFMLVLFPLFYLVFGYLMVAVGCAIYNAMFRYIGGIEFEAGEPRNDA